MVKSAVIFIVLTFSFQCYAGFWDTMSRIKENLKGGSNSSTTKATELSKDELVKGLKETLIVGTKRAISKVAKKDGFYKNPFIKILLPPNLRKVAYIMERAGYEDQIKSFELSMNRAAEEAAKEALPVFVDTVKNITFEDAVKIWKDGDHAATDYLKEKTWEDLYKAFKPIVKNSMKKNGCYKKISGYYKFPVHKGGFFTHRI